MKMTASGRIALPGNRVDGVPPGVALLSARLKQSLSKSLLVRFLVEEFENSQHARKKDLSAARIPTRYWPNVPVARVGQASFFMEFGGQKAIPKHFRSFHLCCFHLDVTDFKFKLPAILRINASLE